MIVDSAANPIVLPSVMSHRLARAIEVLGAHPGADVLHHHIQNDTLQLQIDVDLEVRLMEEGTMPAIDAPGPLQKEAILPDERNARDHLRLELEGTQDPL